LIRRSTDEHRTQTRGASARVRVLPEIEVGTQHPDHEAAEDAAQLVLDSDNRLSRWDAMHAFAKGVVASVPGGASAGPADRRSARAPCPGAAATITQLEAAGP